MVLTRNIDPDLLCSFQRMAGSDRTEASSPTEKLNLDSQEKGSIVSYDILDQDLVNRTK